MRIVDKEKIDMREIRHMKDKINALQNSVEKLNELQALYNGIACGLEARIKHIEDYCRQLDRYLVKEDK